MGNIGNEELDTVSSDRVEDILDEINEDDDFKHLFNPASAKLLYEEIEKRYYGKHEQ